MTNKDVIEMLEKAASASGNGSMAAWCKKKNVSSGTVSMIRAGKMPPTPNILRALGLERVTEIRKIKH